jgi:DNA-binding NarL/FixJ family response regulator
MMPTGRLYIGETRSEPHCRVLLVENHERLRNVLPKSFLRHDCDVTNLDEALRSDLTSYDVLLVGPTPMAEEDLRRLMLTPNCPKVYVLVRNEFSDSSVTFTAARAGVDGYLSLPLSDGVINELLQKPSARKRSVLPY